MDNLVSFIIPHKGRFDMLKETLRSITEQDYPQTQIEVIVVSQTPEIRDEKLISDTELSLTIFIRPESETVSALRNYGTNHSSNNYLAFLDADIYISPNWISTMLSHLEKTPERSIISGTQICEASSPPMEKIRTSLASAEKDQTIAFLPGCNLFLSREVFDKVSGFPEHLITCEDYYFTCKAAQFGSLYRTSDATYIHLGEDKNFSIAFKKEMWRGQSNLLSIRGRSIPIREVPSLILPVGICFSLLSALISLAAGYYPASLLLLGLGLTPVLIYSFRLTFILKSPVNIGVAIGFYLTYFSARAVGIIAGLFKPTVRSSYE